MKKLIALLMSLTLAFALCACGNSGGNEGTTENTAPESTVSDTEEEGAVSDATESQEPKMEQGDKGDGPCDINAGLIKFKLPEGYSYEVYTYYIDEDDPLFGNITIDITKTGSYGLPIRINATTQNFVNSQDEAVQKTIELDNLYTSEEGKSSIGENTKYGDNTYTRVDVSTEYMQETYFVTYAENGNANDAGLHVEFEINTKQMDANDPIIKEILDTLTIVK